MAAVTRQREHRSVPDTTNKTGITGTVPDPAAFTVFKNGDPVVGTRPACDGVTWTALAKLYGSRPNEGLLTDIIGDIGTIHSAHRQLRPGRNNGPGLFGMCRYDVYSQVCDRDGKE